MEELEQENRTKEKSKFEKEHVKISVFLRNDQVDYLSKEHIEPNNSNMSLVVRSAVDVFIEKDKEQKLTILKKVLGDQVYEELVQLSASCGKEIEATMIELIKLNCQPEEKQEIIDDQFSYKPSAD